QQWKLDENTRSLLVHITDSLALNHLGFMLESITSRGLGEFKPALDPTVEQALLRAWASYTTVEKMNFNDLCLNSQSEWDRYTRSLKPNLQPPQSALQSPDASGRTIPRIWKVCVRLDSGRQACSSKR